MNLINIDIELDVFHYCISMYVFPILVSSVPGQEFASQQEIRIPELDTQGFHVAVAKLIMVCTIICLCVVL